MTAKFHSWEKIMNLEKTDEKEKEIEKTKSSLNIQRQFWRRERQ